MVSIKSIVWIGAGAAGLAALFYGSRKLTQLTQLGDKISIIPSVPRIHEFKGGILKIMIDNVKVTNQSSLSVPVQQVFTTVKNGSNELVKQTSPIKPVTIAPYGTTELCKDGPIELSLPLLTSGSALLDLLKGNTSKVLDITTRVTANGFEFPFTQQLDISSVIKGSSSIINVF